MIIPEKQNLYNDIETNIQDDPEIKEIKNDTEEKTNKNGTSVNTWHSRKKSIGKNTPTTKKKIDKKKDKAKSLAQKILRNSQC